MRLLRYLLGAGAVAGALPGGSPVQFDTADWKPIRAASGTSQWQDGDGDTLRVRISHEPARFLADLVDLPSLRQHYRLQAEAAHGAIVSVEMVSVHGVPAVEVITKFERLPAYAFEGTLVFPFEASHCIVTIGSIERGTTGVRDAIITSHLVGRGELGLELPEKGAVGSMKGWFQDPYLEDYRGVMLHSLSDDERLDPLFPRHPLSKVRRALARVEETATLDGTARADPRLPTGLVAASRDSKGGPDRARRPLAAVSVASLYMQAGQFDVAESMLRESLLAPSGSGDSTFAETTMELARVHLLRGKSGEAVAELRRVVEMRERPTIRNRSLAESLLLLGLAYDSRSEFSEAESTLRRALSLLGPAGNETDLLRATVTLNLGRVCISQGKVADAEPLFEQSLRDFEKRDRAGGGTNTAIALNGLGLVANQREKYSNALELFEKALEIFEDAHAPDAATVLRNMSFSWQKLGNDAKAKSCLERAAKIPHM